MSSRPTTRQPRAERLGISRRHREYRAAANLRAQQARNGRADYSGTSNYGNAGYGGYANWSFQPSVMPPPPQGAQQAGYNGYPAFTWPLLPVVPAANVEFSVPVGFANNQPFFTPGQPLFNFHQQGYETSNHSEQQSQHGWNLPQPPFMPYWQYGFSTAQAPAADDENGYYYDDDYEDGAQEQNTRATIQQSTSDSRQKNTSSRPFQFNPNQPVFVPPQQSNQTYQRTSSSPRKRDASTFELPESAKRQQLDQKDVLFGDDLLPDDRNQDNSQLRVQRTGSIQLPDRPNNRHPGLANIVFGEHVPAEQVASQLGDLNIRSSNSPPNQFPAQNLETPELQQSPDFQSVEEAIRVWSHGIDERNRSQGWEPTGYSLRSWNFDRAADLEGAISDALLYELEETGPRLSHMPADAWKGDRFDDLHMTMLGAWEKSIWDFVESKEDLLYQPTTMQAYPTAETVDDLTLPDLSDVEEPSLQNTIHAVFNKNNWFRLSDEGWQNMRPALQLASLLFETKAAKSFMNRLVSSRMEVGEETETVEEGKDQTYDNRTNQPKVVRVNRVIRSYFPILVEDPPEQPRTTRKEQRARVKEIMKMLAQDIDFGFFVKPDIKDVAITSWFGAHKGLTRYDTTKLEHARRFRNNTILLHPTVRDALEDPQFPQWNIHRRIRFLFLLGVTLAHHVVHAFWQLYLARYQQDYDNIDPRMPRELGDAEPRLDTMHDLGNSFEVCVFGHVLYPRNRNSIGADGLMWHSHEHQRLGPVPMRWLSWWFDGSNSSAIINEETTGSHLGGDTMHMPSRVGLLTDDNKNSHAERQTIVATAIDNSPLSASRSDRRATFVEGNVPVVEETRYLVRKGKSRARTEQKDGDKEMKN